MTRGPLTGFLAQHNGAFRMLCRIGFAVSVAAIVVLSLLPGDDIPKFRLSDKIGHLLAYAEIAALGTLGYRGRRAAAMMLTGLAMLGGALELAQDYVPGRSADLLDFGVNCLGLLAGYAAVRLTGMALAHTRA